MASEMGVLPIPEKDIVKKWRLQPGKMLLVDLDEGRLIPDEELKATLAKSHPYKEWLARTQIVLEELPGTANEAPISNLSLLDRQQAFGYTQEDLKFLMTPMATTGEEAVGSMGNDTPISALSDKPKSLFTYFKQNFAQVTNPPIDPIREELVMSLVSIIGPRPNLLRSRRHVEHQTARGASADPDQRGPGKDPLDLGDERRPFQVTQPSISRSPPSMAPTAWAGRSDELCERAEEEVRNGCNIIILSDRKAGADRIPIPALLACAAVHHHLIRNGLRTSVGMVLETGEPREVHHFACLAGYGAEAINPYLAFETLTAMKDELPGKPSRRQGSRQEIHQGDRQRPAQGDVQDGHLHLSVVLRRADFRRRRPASGFRRQVFHRNAHAHRRRRACRDRRRGRAPPPRCLQRRADLPLDARRRRRLRRARARRGPCLDCRKPYRACSTQCAAIRRTTTAPSRRS